MATVPLSPRPTYRARLRQFRTKGALRGLVLLCLLVLLWLLCRLPGAVVPAVQTTPTPGVVVVVSVLPPVDDLRAQVMASLPLPQEQDKVLSVDMVGSVLHVHFIEFAPFYGGAYAQPPAQVANLLAGIAGLRETYSSVVLLGQRWGAPVDEIYLEYPASVVRTVVWPSVSAKDMVRLATMSRVPWWWR